MTMDATQRPEPFEAAFDGLFDRAFRVALRLLGNPQVAEDVAAEALARAFAHWSRIGRLEYRDAWVLRVATNLAVDQLRRKPPVLPLAAGRAPADETAVLRIALAGALRSLPRRQRQAVVLRYLCDLPADDVARVLRISPGSVKTHVHRGLAALRARLGPILVEVIPDVEPHPA
jgi:RNA polymerase sigma factor (sigma-70 family)